jgi:septum formation protein
MVQSAPSPWIYLASQSPRRSQLLQQLGVRHEVLVPEGAEIPLAEALEAVRPNETPADYVQRVTALKLEAALQRQVQRALPAAPILCADTTVALHGHIYGKPENAQQAQQMLTALSGQKHEVLTAMALQVGAQRWEALSVSWVQFTHITPAQIDAYVASGEPLGKAGAYGIQGAAAQYVRCIHGSYSAIMGLDLCATAQMLRAAQRLD